MAKSRARENRFVDFLVSAFGAEHTDEPWKFDESLLKCPVDTEELTYFVSADRSLTKKKREKALEALKPLPSQVRAFDKLTKINSDVVVVRDGIPYFWEFHEEQHRTLKDSRTKKLHCVDGSEIEVPRFLQRLVRDWWRMKYLNPLTIVWFDWFEKNSETYRPTLQPGLVELGLAGKFRFSPTTPNSPASPADRTFGC